MLGLSKTGQASASATATSTSSRDLYQRYAVALYRQALRRVDDSALALVPERGEDDARHRGVLGIYPRDMAAFMRAILRRATGAARARTGRPW